MRVSRNKAVNLVAPGFLLMVFWSSLPTEERCSIYSATRVWEVVSRSGSALSKHSKSATTVSAAEPGNDKDRPEPSAIHRAPYRPALLGARGKAPEVFRF